MQDIQNSLINDYCKGLTFYGADEASGAILDALSKSVKPALGSLLLLLGLVVAAAVIKSFYGALFRDGAALDMCVSLICSVTVYEAIKRSYDAVSVSLSGVAVLMDAMCAAMCAMYGLTGNIAGGSSSVSTLMLCLQVMRLVADKILFPAVLLCFGTSLLSGFGFTAGLSGIAKTVKRAATLLATGTSAAVCAVLSYQRVISKAADGAALRTVKFASSSFIPVIGSSFSESVALVTSSLSNVRAAAGTGGVISLFVILLPAVCAVVSSKLCMRLSSFLCSVLEADSLGAFFDGCNDVLSLLLSVILTVGVIFTAACALFCL